MFSGKLKSARVVFKDIVQCAPAIIQTVLNGIGMFLDCCKIVPYVPFTHYKAIIPYVLKILVVNVLCPVKGYIAALDYEILSVL